MLGKLRLRRAGLVAPSVSTASHSVESGVLGPASTGSIKPGPKRSKSRSLLVQIVG